MARGPEGFCNHFPAKSVKKDASEAVQISTVFHSDTRSHVKASALLTKGLESQNWSGNVWVGSEM